jgi:tetratricopeptide (TPR) repeat protein
LLLAAVAVMVAWTHWPALSARAISFDDDQYLLSNRLVRNPGWASTRRFLGEVLEPSTVSGYYQPLAMISLMLDHALGGRVNHLRPFHATSLGLHVLNTVLVGLLMFGIFGRPWPAGAVALLFGEHPMTVETIPWIGERKTLLAAFFALLSLLAYLGYARRRRTGLLLASLCAYVLALLSKPTSTPLPLVMLLMDAWPLRRIGGRAIVEKLPFLVVGAASAIVTYISQARTSGVILPVQYGPLRLPICICHNLVFYPMKMLWPADLSSHYPFPERFSLADPRQLGWVVGAMLLAAGLVVSLRWTRALACGWIMFVVALLPTMQIVGFTMVIASDKYAYLPAIGLLMVLAWALCGAEKAIRRFQAGGWWLAVGVLGVLLIAAAEARASRRYLIVWQDTETLYRHMIRLAPRSPTLYTNLGNHLLGQQRVDEAIEAHLRAVQYGPWLWQGQNDLANALQEKGRTEEALVHYRKALEIHPAYALGHSNLGIALISAGRTEEGMRHLVHGVELDPRLAIARYSLATALAGQGRQAEAMNHLREALRNEPEHADAHNNLAALLAQAGQREEAVGHFREAVRLAPQSIDARFNLARTLAELGRPEEAIAEYRELLRIDPGDVEARRSLEALQGSTGAVAVPQPNP